MMGMNEELQVVDMDRQAEMQRVSKNIHYQLAKNFDESDAEGTITALVERYPGLVMKILSQRFIKNLATLEAMNSFMKEWSNEEV